MRKLLRALSAGLPQFGRKFRLGLLKHFGKLKPVDLFVIIRTSRRCWRCMYYHFHFNYFEYFSEKTSSMLAKKVEFTYLKMWKAEFDEKERNI